MKNTIPIFVINLIRSYQRRRSVVTQLEHLGLGFEVIPAADKLSLSSRERSLYSSTRTRQKIGRDLTDGELACAISHYRTCQIILQRAMPYALILEDDALFDMRLKKVLDNINLFPDDWGMINLFSGGQFESLPIRIDTTLQVVKFTAKMNSAVGYIITRAAAEKVVDHALPISSASDGLLATLRHKEEIIAYGVQPQVLDIDDDMHVSVIGPRGSAVGSGLDTGSNSQVPQSLGFPAGNKIGICITTYSHDQTHPGRYAIIERCLSSLMETTKRFSASDLCIYIVVDGPVPNRHQQLLDEYRGIFNIVDKEENGGAARGKNTCIRLMLDQNITHGFLVDDDVVFHPGWLEAYVALMTAQDIHHIAGFARQHYFPEGPKWQQLKLEYQQLGEFKLLKHRGAHGHFLTFTPELIEKIGFFNVYPGKMGGWHANFTYRAARSGVGKVSQTYDFADADRFIEHIGQDSEWAWGRPNAMTSVSRHHRNLEWIKNQNENFYSNAKEWVACSE